TRLLVLLFILLTDMWVGTPTKIRGSEEGSVSIDCPYESDDKYLCRSDCRQDADVLVRSTETTKGRYSTIDDKKKRIFTTAISNLSSKDEGRYWCGVTKTGFDKYPSEVSLELSVGKILDNRGKQGR
uniref:Immunoglobulin V-set domain-containing protein n=1 Tax=Poecilia mexicana TaxID=48701 RepID=A0A3B3YIH9_9TELE